MVLRVDLSDQTVTEEPIPDEWLERFIGGKGLGSRYLFDEVPQGVRPLAPQNVLCLFRGPFSGFLPGTTRIVAITKSPLTGIFVDSYTGGTFAEAFVGALAAHAGIIITGRADEPVMLHLADGSGTIEPATEQWGLDVAETTDSIDNGAVACIGPAGEAKVRYATIATDAGKHHAGRGGTGAVMGSKRLKAIVAEGELPTDPNLESVRARYEDRFDRDHRGRWHRHSGTVETIDAANATGVLPTRGWTEGRFEAAANLGVEAIKAVAGVRERTTSEIPGDFELDEQVPRGALGIALGANLGIGTLDDVLELGRTCDTLGLDVIEAGNALAWAMLAYERELIDRELGFGDVTAAKQLLFEIGTRSSRLGELLAEGIDRAAASLGGDDLIPTVKSMSAASYDPRPSPGMALAFATSDRGACHRRSRPIFDELLDTDPWDDDERIQVVIKEQNLRAVLWSYIVDDITAPAFEDDLGIEYFDAIGWETSSDELWLTGERIWTLTRLFNVREGITSVDDRLPTAFTRPIVTGPQTSAAVDPAAFEVLRDRYYRGRGWTEDGRLTPALLEEVSLAGLHHSSPSR